MVHYVQSSAVLHSDLLLRHRQCITSKHLQCTLHFPQSETEDSIHPIYNLDTALDVGDVVNTPLLVHQSCLCMTGLLLSEGCDWDRARGNSAPYALVAVSIA